MKKMYKVIKNKKIYSTRNKVGQFKKFSLLFRIKVKFETWYEKWKYHIAALVLGIIIGLLFGCAMFYPYKTSPNDLGLKNVGKVQEVEAFETPCDYDPITYLRCKGQKLGIKDTEISKIIATMKCESGLKSDALNKNSNGTFDVGIGQINDVHNKRISREDRMNFVKNIDFIYTLYQEQGLNPWVCSHKLGYVK